MKAAKKLYNLLIVFFVDYAILRKILNIWLESKWVDEIHSNKIRCLKRENKESFSRYGNDDLKSFRMVPDNIDYDEGLYQVASLNSKFYIYQIEDAQLIGEFPLIYTHNNRLIKDSVFFSDEHTRIWSQLYYNYVYQFKFFFRKNKITEVDTALLMFSRWNHYGHWIPEHVLKLKEIGNLPNVKDIKLVLEKNPPNWKLDILNRLGWDRSRLIFWDFFSARVNKLIVPSYPVYRYEDYKWLKENIFPDGVDELEGYERIYLSREKYINRKVSNEKELCDFLQLYGFKVIYPEALSFDEQVKIFHNAKVIVGPHGSAFTNLIFSEDALVVEFNIVETITSLAYVLSKIMGHNAVMLYCENKGSKNSDITVPIDKLQKIFLDNNVCVEHN